MSSLAAVRPDSWNLPLLLHVLGAAVLVGGLATAATAQLLGWRRTGADAVAYGRLAFRSLLLTALPGWILMRLGADWIYRRGPWTGEGEPAWLQIGWLTADLGGLLLVVSIVLAGLGARKLSRSGGEPTVLVRIATVLTTAALLAYVVAVWAMSGKPV
jgi:hypothetical protein